jgi:hypothetical protein
VIEVFIGMLFGAVFSWSRCPQFLMRKPQKPLEPQLKDAKEAALEALEACLIEHHEEWEQQSHNLVHKKSGIKIWTANEDYALNIKGISWELTKEEIPSEWRARIWKACKKEELSYRALVRDLTKAFSTPLQLETRERIEL